MKYFLVNTESGSFSKTIKAKNKKEAKSIAIERFKLNKNEVFEILLTIPMKVGSYLNW